MAFIDFLALHPEVNFMSRDIIFLGYDGSKMANGQAIQAFMEAYHTERGGELS